MARSHPKPSELPSVRTVIVIVITAIAAVSTYYLLPQSVNELARRTAAIFVVAAMFWATEVLPLYATSLCVIGMQVLFLAEEGGLASNLGAVAPWPTDPDGSGAPLQLNYTAFLEPFSSSIIFLFMGGFLLSRAVSTHGLDRAVARRLLKPVAHRPLVLIYAVMGIAAFFSMWMSNTATAAMMLALIAPLIRDLPADHKYVRALVLAVPFGANIGGVGTPIGTPPNAIAMAALLNAGYRITFLDWMMLAVPLAIVLLAITGAMLYWFYRPEGGKVELGEIDVPQKMTLRAKLAGVILLIAMVLWLTGKWHGLNPAVTALLAAAALTAFQILDKHDVDSIDWNILLLMWGGLSLGIAMEQTQLVNVITTLPVAELSGVALAFAVVVASVGLSTFMSNTAAANLIIPMVMAITAGTTDARDLTLLCAFACSFAMAMPVSTPPNAIAFSTGRIPVRSLLRAGGLVTLIATLALLAGYRYMIPLIL